MRLSRRVGLAAPALLLAARALPVSAQTPKLTIAMVPLITTDAFYVTLGKGAQDAATALGVNLLYQGPATADTPQQVNILNAMIGRKPDVLVIAPSDRVQLVVPMRKAFDAGIPVITVDTYIGDSGVYQTGSGAADFPLSYIASDNTVLHDRMAEARITYGGRGQLTEVQRPRWGQQLMDILLPF